MSRNCRVFNRKVSGDKVHRYDGIFHCFSTSFIEFESGPGHFPVAVVEKPDGQIEVVDADSVRFIDVRQKEGENV